MVYTSGFQHVFVPGDPRSPLMSIYTIAVPSRPTGKAYVYSWATRRSAQSSNMASTFGTGSSRFRSCSHIGFSAVFVPKDNHFGTNKAFLPGLLPPSWCKHHASSPQTQWWSIGSTIRRAFSSKHARRDIGFPSDASLHLYLNSFTHDFRAIYELQPCN